MKDIFPGWYTKTADDFKALWDRAIFVPDTNILLHLLRHSAGIRAQLMAVFERKKEALWIPYQVGAEFQRRRLDVRQSAIDAYDRLVEELKASFNQARNKLNQFRAHPVIDIDRELSALDVYLSDFERRMSEARSKHPTEELTASFTRVTELFSGRVGAKPTEERLVAIRKEGEERYAKKIPPGFEDAKKGGDSGDKFGDLIIWKELIDKAKAEKRPIIFVTDDGKSDWWYIHHGKKIGPHPFLIEEFVEATGEQFHIYELPEFLRYSVETGSAIPPEAVQKIADTLIADTQTAVNQSSLAERALAMRAVRSELRGKEFELDALIKSLIDFPPSTGEELPRDDAKRTLKLRIGELTEVVSVLREKLGALESDQMQIEVR
jgi:hypothetical protein